jgi:hypothetical protein
MDSYDQPQSKEATNKRLVNGLSLKDVSFQLLDELKPSQQHIRPWQEAKRLFLKLYINQRKNPKKVGDTLMFSTHQTILAALYRDVLDAEWGPRDEDDVDKAEMLNALWQFDYDEMGKPSHDFDKYWDACFYGTAIEDWSHFDRKALTPVPGLWDPLNTYLDPNLRHAALMMTGETLIAPCYEAIYIQKLRGWHCRQLVYRDPGRI